jgi:Na+-translocating ferredoxin:NAD+ oxidoreductase subunit G
MPSVSLMAPSRLRIAAAASIALAAVTLPAHATDYWTPTKLLREFFLTSKKVSAKHVTLTDAEVAEIAKKLGTAPSKLKRGWSVYVGESADGKRTGYAILDAEIGQHELIDFGVRLGTGGAVERLEIMAFREPYGDGIRIERFRNQFVGKTAKDPITAGRDIDIISGATLSSRSVALGVKRDTLVLEAALKNGL